MFNNLYKCCKTFNPLKKNEFNIIDVQNKKRNKKMIPDFIDEKQINEAK